MHVLVESIRKQWCLEWGFPPNSPTGSTLFYRDHVGKKFTCGCERYFELLDAVPLRVPGCSIQPSATVTK